MSFLNLCFRTSPLSKLATRTAQNLKSVRTYARSHILKVTVCGGAGRVAKLVCLLLKQSPLIDELCVYDVADTVRFAKELAHVDTGCKVSAYTGKEYVKKALQNSKIVVILASSPKTAFLSYSAMFDPNALIMQELIEQFSYFCPKALLAIATNPVNSMVPLASEVLKAHGVYNPNTVFGITTTDVVRANSFAAEVQGLEPECVFVPVIGGHSDNTIIPVLSHAKPCNDFTNAELEKITLGVQSAHRDMIKAKFKESANLSCAFAISRFTLSLVKALRRKSDIIECAYVKSNVHPGTKYLATPLRLGPAGIQKNLGLPELSEYERCLLENAVPLIADDVIKGERYAKGLD
ncbi:hypothetical protein ILUMI_10898 [Ignelater luminosus]|uniref:Malate dehydrogenase, mitochondrial n=1 Tax=Ignelater luminosus TaxID=2038154 RepID=A0A8K0GB09_IGNLU|nr:hypothetical protein ILUMI_10898 [Ignelater luminosus]